MDRTNFAAGLSEEQRFGVEVSHQHHGRRSLTHHHSIDCCGVAELAVGNEHDVVFVVCVRPTGVDTAFLDDFLTYRHDDWVVIHHLQRRVVLSNAFRDRPKDIHRGDGRYLTHRGDTVHEIDRLTHLGRASKCFLDRVESGDFSDVHVGVASRKLDEDEDD